MGASSSKIEEDKALQLCRERKKFVRQALDGRCSLAASHVAYVQSLRNTGTALRKFVEPEGPIESSLCTSTIATPEVLALTEKSLSQFSFYSLTVSQHVDANETISPSPSPPSSSQFQANHMRFRGVSSQRVEEKPPSPVIGTVTSSSTPDYATTHYTEKPESSPIEDSTIPPAWDFFGINPVDHQFSFQKGSGMNLDDDDYVRTLKEAEGIPDLENTEDDASFHEREESQDSEDGFDEPSTDTLVRKFENFNRKQDPNAPSASPIMPSIGSVASESEFINEEKSNSPDLSPVGATFSRAGLPTDMKEKAVKEDGTENKVTPKDFVSTIKDVELLFIKASECGKEVPRMLEANKLHFRPIFPAKESGSIASTFFKACFSCGEEHIQVQEEPAQTPIKYLTWHRIESSRSSSSRNPLGLNSKDDVEDLGNNVFDSMYMISGSHASTLDRLYAWERKLYDEVKASEMVRREYDSKCKILRQLESKGLNTKVDKTRAVVKDLFSRIKVAIHRIESISKRIEELRDTELQPQLEELIEGLSRMWEVMFECHKLQFDVISVAYSNGNRKISIQSDSHRQITIQLENELNSLSSSFTKWIDSQTFYLRAINNWLFKCVIFPQKSSKKKRRVQLPPLTHYGPPIYTICGRWLERLENLGNENWEKENLQKENLEKKNLEKRNPLCNEVVESIKSLVAEIIRFLPHQEKNQGKSPTGPFSTSWKADNGSDQAVKILTDEASEDCIAGFDRFRSSLEEFIGQLKKFAKSSVEMYAELGKEIEEAKINHAERISQEAKSNSDQLPSKS